MATFIEEKKKQKRLIFILFAVLAITGIVLWYGFLIQLRMSPEQEVQGPGLEFQKTIEINTKLLETPLLKELQLFEKIPPFEEETGRQNPFLPY